MSDFPGRFARTRRFSNGLPRALQLSAQRALFLRSPGPEDPVHALWSVELATGTERQLCDPRSLGDDGDIPAEERARRERARESGSGIVAYSATPDLSRVCFALYGKLFVIDTDGTDAVELPVDGPIVDPRIEPSGEAITFVRERRLWLTDLAGVEVELAGDDDAAVSWGLAEHIAAEEMDRLRGHWWAPDGGHVLAARVDESMVEVWHISDPSDPGAVPATIRYPRAGSANAEVSLALLSRDAAPLPVTWDRDALPYLAAVSFRTDVPLLLVQSRDQRTTQVLRVDRRTGTTTVLRQDTDPSWVELVPGTPEVTPDGRAITVRASRDDDTYRLFFDDEPVTPSGLQVRGVCGVGADGVHIVASDDPAQAQVYRIGYDGAIDQLTKTPGVNTCTVGDGVVAVVSADMDRSTPAMRVLTSTPFEIAALAEEPDLVPTASLVRVGDRELAAAVLYPSDHVPGTPLPVILDPYGGPHAQRVLARRSAYLLSQWIADQGFAVIVIDGRGTPGRGPAWDRAIEGDLASAPLQDQVDGLMAAAATHPDLDLRRVGIRGWSFGGYLALLAILRRPDVFHAAVAGAPVTEWRLYDTHYTERYLGDPATNAAAYDASSALGDADGLRGALQIIHGLNDDNVVVSHSVLLSRELLLRGKLHDCLLIPGITHMAGDPDAYSALLQREIDFFRRALS